MEKQLIRQLQKSGNGYSVRVPPEVREDLQANKQGDNVSWEHNPDSGKWEFGKVAQPNPGDETQQNIETESGVDNETQSQQPEPKFKFCSECGSPNIDVTGNKYYCHKCDVLYEFSAGGVIAVKLNPLSEDYGEIKSRLENLEQNQNQIVGELNSAFGENLVGEFGNGLGNKDEDNPEHEPEHNPEPKHEKSRFAKFVETVTCGIVGINGARDENGDYYDDDYPDDERR